MTPADPPATDDSYYDLLAQWDHALATGGPLPVVPDETSSRRRRLNGDLSLLQRLRQTFPTETPAPVMLPEPLLPPGANGTRFGRFILRRELGRGGFGIVYLADDPDLGRAVALKVPRVEALTDPELRGRFLREARAAGSLDHPNVVAVHEVGEVGPVSYIVSAYCSGPNLARWLTEQREPVAPADAAYLIAALADGVEHAHQKGILHRDLKPANVLLGEQTADAHSAFRGAKITDFGLAKLLDAGMDDTASGMIMGTPAYMAPEQAEGRLDRIGPTTDVYALGVILYELLTRTLPARGESLLMTLEQVRSSQPVPPSRLRGDLPRDLETICLKCLRKEPPQRFTSAGELAADLRRFAAGESITARPLSGSQVFWNWSRRPERMRDAGVIGFFNLAMLSGGSLSGLLLVLSGLLPVQRIGAAIFYMLCLFVGFGAFQWWLARGALRRDLRALWAGTLVPFLFFGLQASTLFGGLDTGAVIDPNNRSPWLAQSVTLLLLFGLQIVSYAAGIASWHAQQRQMPVPVAKGG